MKSLVIEELEHKLLELERKYENSEIEEDIIDSSLLDLLNDLNFHAEACLEGEEELFSNLIERTSNLIENNNTNYDEEEVDIEDVYDMMFPDRHEEDFDEDSMSYDSVFGDD